MLTVNYKPVSGGYIENAQVNPILFCILKEKESVFNNVTNWFKCRDFFNDIVYTKQTGTPLVVYGLNSNLGLSKDEPIYAALDKLIPEFEDNWELVNSYLEKENLPRVELYKSNVTVAKIHEFYTESTYNIALLTALMRLLNYKKINNLEEIKTIDVGYTESLVRDAITFPLFKLPQHKQGHIFYLGAEINSNKKVQSCYLSTYVHSNGIIGWKNAP